MSEFLVCGPVEECGVPPELWASEYIPGQNPTFRAAIGPDFASLSFRQPTTEAVDGEVKNAHMSQLEDMIMLISHIL